MHLSYSAALKAVLITCIALDKNILSYGQIIIMVSCIQDFEEVSLFSGFDNVLAFLAKL